MPLLPPLRRQPARQASPVVARLANSGRRTTLAVLATVALLGGSAAAEERARLWQEDALNRVELVAAEGVTAHPARVPRELVEHLLAATRLDDRPHSPVFPEAESRELAGHLADALSLADKNEEVRFISSPRHGDSLFAPRRTATGRVFVADGALHLIVAGALLDRYDQFRATGHVAKLPVAGRREAGSVQLAAAGDLRFPAAPRRDWLAIDLATATSAASASAAAPGATPGSSPGAARGAPATAGATSAGQPAPRGEAYYQALEERLQALQRLRERGLVTDDEYRDKRQEILRGL